MTDEKTINVRFLELYEHLKSAKRIKSLSDLASRIEVSSSLMTEITKGRSNVGVKVLQNTVSSFPEVNLNWLLTGVGEMISVKSTNHTSIPVAQESETGYGVPLIPIDAMAGWGEGDVSVMEYDAGKYVIPEFSEQHVDFLIRVKGSSMYPKYNSGDIVACKKLPIDTFFQWNKVYVLDTIQGAVIKRVKRSSEKSAICCVSDNAAYEPFDLPLSEVRSLALVVGVIRLE